MEVKDGGGKAFQAGGPAKALKQELSWYIKEGKVSVAGAE